jgi:hypothetical protein
LITAVQHEDSQSKELNADTGSGTRLPLLSKQPWNGKHFFTVVPKEKGPTKRTLWLKQNEVAVEFSESE